MSNFKICKQHNIVGVFSFTTGFIASPKREPRTENEILAKAMWLVRHDQEDAALQLIDSYCSRSR